MKTIQSEIFTILNNTYTYIATHLAYELEIILQYYVFFYVLLEQWGV